MGAVTERMDGAAPVSAAALTALLAPGAEDRFQVLRDTDQRLAAPVRALIGHIAGRDDVGTLMVRGRGPAGLPRLDRLYFRFGRPIRTTRWGGHADDPAAAAECRDLVKAQVESELQYLLALRNCDSRRGLLPRALDAVREVVPV